MVQARRAYRCVARVRGKRTEVGRYPATPITPRWPSINAIALDFNYNSPDITLTAGSTSPSVVVCMGSEGTPDLEQRASDRSGSPLSSVEGPFSEGLRYMGLMDRPA